MPFKKARYVNFKTVLITVISYTLVSTFVSLWCPVTVNCTRDKRKSGVKCELLRPTVYKVCGTLSTIFMPLVFLGILDILIVHHLKSYLSTRNRLKGQGNVDRNITCMLITVGVTLMVMSFPLTIYWLYVQIRQITMPNKTVFILTQTFPTPSLFHRELRKIFQCINRRDKKINNNQRTKPFNTMNKRDILPEHKNFL
ncbi:unnamed protein product [Rotaria magnacalcarata]|uniref:G-protein coupled receptors family 1 profile domain-containing protein n=2 Tax=Rotaria magnacalcarata TaxID=392030 RepID=A0A8S2RWX7_9BILA|nr:unnamed protein product [Rotaria magnacalcarata]CAF4180529.1 unnamed protein product [Rotaria magnacalcarata]CAF4262501.1 unnamed protein product [Rotaria magnacalcarata]